MESRFTHEQRLLHQLVLHSNDVPARGLMDGQMGIVLVLSEYERVRKLTPLKIVAKFLLEQITDNLSTENPLEFANGLTGIGWGVEYLLQNKFQRGSGTAICAAIDQKLMQQNILRQTDFSLDKGLEGWFHYVIAHIQGAQREGSRVFDAAYLQDCLTVCTNLLRQDITPSLKNLCQMFIAITHGQTVNYTFDLSAFITPPIKPSTLFLGLRKGLAGQLFSLLKSKLS